MRKGKAMKDRLLQDRERLMREREALDNQITGLERAIALIEDKGSEQIKGAKKQPIKALVLDLLEEVGTTGINGATVVKIASARGVTVERSSVSSLLSRLKADGIVTFDGSMYRLPRYAAPAPTRDLYAVS